MLNLSGQRPTNLGLQNGRLLACPNTPNCVCSYDVDPGHKIDPLTYQSTSEAAIAALKQIIQSNPGAQLITEKTDYLYAEFTIPFFGFVDDVEFYLDSATKVIQVRSASRMGQSDLGVNRKRIEAIRAKFQQASV
jgi:uncharacterized protein (DUF1499 family)